MKKAIFKISGLVAVATLMILNTQFTNMDEGSMISLSYLKNMAFAQGGENGGRNDHTPDPKNCTYVVWECKVDVFGYETCIKWSKGGTKIDCLYWKGSTCSPTACS